jgi:hypothetical protein
VSLENQIYVLEERNPHKTRKSSCLGPVDVEALRASIALLPSEAWDRSEDYDANYNKRGAILQANHITLKFADRRSTPIQYFDLPAWESWKKLVSPVIDASVAQYGYAIGIVPRAMLARLQPRTFIPPHIDGDHRGHISHKIHVPLVTNDRSFFFEDGIRHHFKVGFAYEVNNGLPHHAANGGEGDRTHLIFEYLDRSLQVFTDPPD